VRVEDLVISTLVEVDDDLAVMVDDMKRARAAQFFFYDRRIINLYV